MLRQPVGQLRRVGGAGGVARAGLEPVGGGGMGAPQEDGGPVLAAHGEDPSALHVRLQPVAEGGAAEEGLARAAHRGRAAEDGRLGVLHAVQLLPRHGVLPVVLRDSRVAGMAAGQQHAVARSGFRVGMVVVGGGEVQALPLQLAQAPRQVPAVARQQVRPQLVHGDHQQQAGARAGLGLGRERGRGEEQGRGHQDRGQGRGHVHLDPPECQIEGRGPTFLRPPTE